MNTAPASKFNHGRLIDASLHTRTTCGGKQFGVVDTNGLLLGVCVLPASVSDNVGGIAVIDAVRAKLERFKHLWCDAGFKRTFVEHCRHHHIGATTVARISEPGFHVMPRRWVIERTWSWIMNHRRLQIDYERDPPSPKASHGPPTADNSSDGSDHEPRRDNIRDSLSVRADVRPSVCEC